MPIRINLLAEAQALEDLRRRDPVKRAIWVGAFLVFLILLWSSSLQLKAMIGKGALGQVNAQLDSQSNTHYAVLKNQEQLTVVSHKLDALQQLATNRFLNGTVLNALQQATVDDVQLVRLRAEQLYVLTEAVKAKTNSNKRVTPPKPATVTEKIMLTLDARDNGATPGDQVNKFKQAITDCAYFQDALGKTNQIRLINLSPPQTGADGKPYVLFTLECPYPEKTR